MKQTLKINEMEINSIDELYKIIYNIQLHNGFTPVEWEFIRGDTKISFGGLVVDLTPLGENRMELTIMYHFKDVEREQSEINSPFYIYFLDDNFHCNIFRGFMKVIVSESVIEKLEREMNG
jgi:hypothetical protein